MQVIPRIFGLLGAVTGITFLCLVGGMTWFTISALFYAAEKTGKTTYASVVSAYAAYTMLSATCTGSGL